MAVNHDATSITIEFEGQADLEVSDIWPDGDAPDDITADAVVALLRKDTKAHTLTEWNLVNDIRVLVHVHRRNPAYHGPVTLPGTGEPPPAFFSSHEEAW